MKQISMVRGRASVSDLMAALDSVGVKDGEGFVVMSESHRNELVRETGRRMASRGFEACHREGSAGAVTDGVPAPAGATVSGDSAEPEGAR